MADCLFCKIMRREIPAKIAYDDEKAFAFVDINPQAPVHMLIVPKRHVATLNDLKIEDRELLGHLFYVAAELARGAKIDQAGYRTVINTNAEAGQSVFHIHVHLLGGRAMRWPPG
ncbi:MAG: histidine triad nucleotide-binding protein [Acidobacteria bacterium]|nr:histidine triad nucleotide-binding protein [Acidobacteriota bacterium]MBI3655336.1 histidine triad nucleotide-binding protein [Acidobacteriota bacterium]